jgi:hypothetical protein
MARNVHSALMPVSRTKSSVTQSATARDTVVSQIRLSQPEVASLHDFFNLLAKWDHDRISNANCNQN